MKGHETKIILLLVRVTIFVCVWLCGWGFCVRFIPPIGPVWWGVRARQSLAATE